MRCLIILIILLPLAALSQCKTYSIGVKGDTLNCTDNNNLKQGKWAMHVESLRGEPGYEQEGFYKDDKKEGAWRTYSLAGDLLSLENYKWGYKNGISSYFNLYGLQREESWKAIDPKNPYDTVDVPALNSDTVYKRIVKVDAYTVKQGTWNYYDPQIGKLVKTEEYVLDQIAAPLKKKALTANISDSASLAKADTIASSKMKPKEVLQYEKKNSNKKKIKVRDGVTGVH